MDISGIDSDFIENFALSYIVASDVFGVNPNSASQKNRRKIRKWVEKHYIVGENYPPDVEKFIGKNVSDESFIEFIKLCYDNE